MFDEAMGDVAVGVDDGFFVAVDYFYDDGDVERRSLCWMDG